jgi:hypothetical protein
MEIGGKSCIVEILRYLGMDDLFLVAVRAFFPPTGLGTGEDFGF